jgi:predicted transposase/invertase (TIGR01784 family)
MPRAKPLQYILCPVFGVVQEKKLYLHQKYTPYKAMRKVKETREERETSVFMNPRTDFGFKKLFFDKELLIAFLNEVLEREEIVDIEYLPAEQLGESSSDRRAIFDIYCSTAKKENVIVEMQVGRQACFADRALFYAASSIRSQAPRGEDWNYQLKAVYLVAVLDFDIFTEKEDGDYVMERAFLMRERTKTRFSDKLDFLFIELQKFRKPLRELETNTDKWLYCLKNLDKLKSRPAVFNGDIFERLFKKARIKRLTPEEMGKYRESILEYSDVRRVAEYNRAEGHAAGRAEGINIGMEQGMEQSQKAFIKKCLKKKMSIEEIAELTELSIGRIKELRVELDQ